MNITVADMKANLSEILCKAANGEDVEITRHGKPYVRIITANPERPVLPRVGAFEGQFELPDNWPGDDRKSFGTYRGSQLRAL